MALVNLENIVVTYGDKKKEAKVEALKKINLIIEEGEFITIRGKSGCGKTTLLNVIGGVVLPTEGTYSFSQVNKQINKMNCKELTTFRRENIGYVVQQFALIDDLSVKENILLPLIYRKVATSIRHQEVEKIMKQLDISEYKNRKPVELSGGQKQRVAIARALVTHPQLILADEPTGALDEESGIQIMEILKSINENGTTIIMVTHDNELASWGKHRIIMRDGEIIEDLARNEENQ